MNGERERESESESERERGGRIYIYIVIYKYTQMHRPLSFCKGLMHTDDLFSASLLSALLTADELQVTSKPSAEASSAPHCTRKNCSGHGVVVKDQLRRA